MVIRDAKLLANRYLLWVKTRGDSHLDVADRAGDIIARVADADTSGANYYWPESLTSDGQYVGGLLHPYDADEAPTSSLIVIATPHGSLRTTVPGIMQADRLQLSNVGTFIAFSDWERRVHVGTLSILRN